MVYIAGLFGVLGTFAIVGSGSPLLSASTQTNNDALARISQASYICNYAVAIAKKGNRASVYRSPRSYARVVAKLRSNAPVYVCDGQVDWYQVRFNGSCKRRFNDGLRVERARLCSIGWMRKRIVDVRSG